MYLLTNLKASTRTFEKKKKLIKKNFKAVSLLLVLYEGGHTLFSGPIIAINKPLTKLVQQ